MAIVNAGRLAALWLCAGIALAPCPASAHAIIVTASPAVDAVVHGPSVAVVLRFNSRLDRARSRLTLFRPDGSSAMVPLNDDGKPDTLAGTIADLRPGAYRLHWQVLAVDGHITRGDIPFKVAP